MKRRLLLLLLRRQLELELERLLLLLLLRRQLELERLLLRRLLLLLLLRRQLELERLLLRWQLELEARTLGRGAPPLPLDNWCGWRLLGPLRKIHTPWARRRRLLSPHSRHNAPSFDLLLLRCFDLLLIQSDEILVHSPFT